MNQQKHTEDLHIGRGWLNRAAEMLDSCEDHVSDAEFARAAAAIGNGFIALAHAERAMRSSATLDAAAERVRRAAAEARPHDSCAICTPEPDDTVPPSCTFVHDSHRCVYELAQGEHTYHRLPDGREVDDRGELAPQEDDRG